MEAFRLTAGPVQGETNALLPRRSQTMMQTRDDDGKVLFGVGTVMSGVRLTRLLPASLTVGQAIEEVRLAGADDAAKEHALRLLESELAAPQCEYFAASPTGPEVTVQPGTRLADIAFMTEIRTAEGLRNIRAAEVHVQAYSRVGCCHG